MSSHDDRVGAEAAQERLERGGVEAVHAHLLDDEVALLRLEPVGRRRAPGAAHEPVRALHALEERRVLLQPRRARLDDVPDVDHRHAGAPR